VSGKSIRLLAKALRPLPEKFHGLTDHEARYRQRYVDLIVNPQVRDIFLERTRIIQAIRDELRKEGYLEVETPMMQPIPGGAAARPFKTHHNALDMDLFLRIAPELYLKRLVVGGVERVFEINRNFRNEGMSTRHNPEFTMLEWYAAYEDWTYMMDSTERLIRAAAQGRTTIAYQGKQIDLAKPFARLPIPEAIRRQGVDVDLRDRAALSRELVSLKIEHKASQGWGAFSSCVRGGGREAPHRPDLRRRLPRRGVAARAPARQRSEVTDRFELFIDAKEIANGFSELNDPEDQAQRFLDQVKNKNAVTRKPCTTTPTTSARSSTACRPRRAAAWASTGWSCC